MRIKNPEVMQAICSYVDRYYREKHTTPSTSEIAEGVGISKATSYRYLVAMNENGMLSYDGKSIITRQNQPNVPRIIFLLQWSAVSAAAIRSWKRKM